MIIDHLINAPLYYSVHPPFEKAFEYLKSIELDSCIEGTFEVDGNNIKSIVSTNELKSKETARLETHRKHIDIQIPLSQTETYGWRSFKTMDKTIDNYDSEKDFELFDDEPSAYITLSKGEFIIFFPDDAHAPLIGSGEIKKLIFKILID